MKECLVHNTLHPCPDYWILENFCWLANGEVVIEEREISLDAAKKKYGFNL